MSKGKFLALGLGLALSSVTVSSLNAATIVTPIYKTAPHDVQGQLIGNIVFADSKYGLIIIPNLKNLTPGAHGFHIHVNPSCADRGLAAGGHFDPRHTGKHLGPYHSQGHLGDLPVLLVGKDGKANLPLLAPRLKTSMIKSHSIMIHADGDNYSDIPAKLGGGGARVACGVIK